MPSKRKSVGRSSTRSRRSAPIPAPVEEDEPSPSVHEESPAPTPQLEEPAEDDEAMPDADEEEDVEIQAEAETGDGLETPAQDDEDEDDDQEEDDDAAPARPSSRTRRAGRSGKPVRGTRASDWGIAGTPDPVPEDTSDAGSATPKRGRGRGRGTRGGFRGRLKMSRGSSNIQLPMDKHGNIMEVEEDEIIQPEDEEGETKVDKLGNLLGGREYRVRTFQIPERGEKLYMLSTEPARCTGFRDSYLFFAKHPNLYKIIVNETEKRDMIDRDIIPHSYKGRAIGVVTARSVYREFGCRIVLNGKKITDDYKVREARERGDKEGELAESQDAIAPPGRMQYRMQGLGHPSFPISKFGTALKPRKALLTDDNWMLEHALSASRYNSELAAIRKQTADGIYDIHLNFFNYPANTQPSHARWEYVPSPAPDSVNESRKRKFAEMNGSISQQLVNGHSASIVNGVGSSPPLTSPSTPQPTSQDPAETNKYLEGQDQEEESSIPASSTAFPALSNVLTRNFLIVDTHFQSPPGIGFGVPGPMNLSLNPLTDGYQPGVPSLTEQEMDEMGFDEKCKAALLQAQGQESKWRSSWAGETESGCRGTLRCGVGM